MADLPNGQTLANAQKAVEVVVKYLLALVPNQNLCMGEMLVKVQLVEQEHVTRMPVLVSVLALQYLGIL